MAEDKRAAALLAARLQRIPTTRYTWLFVVLGAGALVVEALDIGSLGIILPTIRKLMHLTPANIGELAASSALGIVIGMIPCGYLADRYGRKRLLIGGVLWFAGGTMLSAFSPNFGVLLVLRGLCGLGMAPAFIMPYSLLSELVSATTRTAFSSVLETALGIGYILPPVLAFVIVPVFPPDLSWRVFLFVAGLPFLYVWFIWKYLPESPRWLSRAGETARAEEIVSALERNTERVLGRPLARPEIGEDTDRAVAASTIASLRSLAVVWRPPYLRRTIAMMCGAVGTFSLFYITVNYVPTLLVERHIALANVFLFTLIITAAQIPWKIVNGVAAEYIGRKKVYVIFMGLAALAAWRFGLAATPLAMVLWGMMLHSASGSAPAYKMWYAEQYPTHIRAIGQSTVEAIGGRLVGGVLWTFLFPVLIASFGLTVTMDISAVIGLAGMVIATAFAPETFRRTVETIESELAATEPQSRLRPQPKIVGQ